MASFYNVLARSINGEIYRQWAKSLTHRRPLEFHLLAEKGKKEGAAETERRETVNHFQDHYAPSLLSSSTFTLFAKSVLTPA